MNKRKYENNFHEQISLFLDKALEPEQEAAFRESVKNDPMLWQAVEQEKSFRKIIKSKFSAPKLAPDFVKDIKDKISH